MKGYALFVTALLVLWSNTSQQDGVNNDFDHINPSLDYFRTSPRFCVGVGGGMEFWKRAVGLVGRFWLEKREGRGGWERAGIRLSCVLPNSL